MKALLAALKEFWWHVENRVPPGERGDETPNKGSLEGHRYTGKKPTIRSRKKSTSGVTG
jgi:hypothetical protein